MSKRQTSSSSSADAQAVIEDMLRNSLKSLGIESARFASLPPAQRRLALADTLIGIASELTSTLKWVTARAGLADQRIEDLDAREVDMHRAMLDCLISLCCIGETSFLTSLVPYLHFPDPRWSIGVDALLRSLVYGKADPRYSVPNATQRRHWAAWCITTHAGQRYFDLAGRVLGSMWGDFHETKGPWSELRDTSEAEWLLAIANPGERRKLRYDPEEVAFCNSVLVRNLLHRDARSLCSEINRFVSTRDSGADFATTSAFLEDNIQSLNVAATVAAQAATLIKSQQLSPEATGVIARGLTAFKSLKVIEQLALSWVTPKASRILRFLVRDVLGGRMTTKSVRALTYVVHRGNRLGTRRAEILKLFLPRLEDLSHRWMCTSIFAEMDKACSLVILEHDGPEQAYERLWKRFFRQAADVNRAAEKLLSITSILSMDTVCDKKFRMVLRWRSLLDSRNRMEHGSARELAASYQTLLDEIKQINSGSPRQSESLQ
jgi:hypothetical protein